MDVQIQYANEKYFESFHKSLDLVARERIYIEMIEGPPLASVTDFQKKIIAANAPAYYAIAGGQVVGWADINLSSNPRMQHRGFLGMGLLPEWRGKGLGTKLLMAVIEHSKKIGLEKLELNVYTNNTAGIALYRKCGFVQEGLIKNFRKLDGVYFDCLTMGLFLK